MNFFGSSPTPAAPTPPPPPPSTTDQAAQQARTQELAVANNAKGRAATLLTGGQGVTDTANIGRTKLLGG